MQVLVKVPGSCGELIQGKVSGKDLLVTCPINLYSQVSIKESNHNNFENINKKSFLAITRTLEYLNIQNTNYKIKLVSELLQGKGMASSSADISAVIKAIGLINNVDLSAEKIAEIAIGIEPTDGIFFEGIVAFDHIKGEVLQYLGQALPITIGIFDFGGSVDTINFNNRFDLLELNNKKEKYVKKAYDLLERGFLTKDTKIIGEATTISALANQEILYKDKLDKIIDIVVQNGGLGINIAHSGTLLGVLFNNSDAEALSFCIDELNSKFARMTYYRTVNLVNGGIYQEGE